MRHGPGQPDLAFGPVAQPSAPLLLAGPFDFDLLLVVPAGAFGSRRALARIDAPVAKGVRLGLGRHLQHDLGWLHNTATGERLNRGLRAGLAGTLDIDLAPMLSLALTSPHARSKVDNLPAFACNQNTLANCGGRFASTGQLAQPR